ncbi:MAG TPA: CopD family protein [Saprospiraceae bacterium]|nr:CopD family protein [Saprospiraceae bacterium]
MERYDAVTFLVHTAPEWFELISLTFCIGILVCRIWVIGVSSDNGMTHEENSASRMWRFLGIGISAAILGSAAEMLVRAMEISAQPFESVIPVLPTVFFHTHIGHVWLIRITGLLLLFITFAAAGRYHNSRKLLLFMLGLGFIVTMTKSASGHASDAGDFSLPEIMDWLHLIAASFWGGGLFVLSLVILPDLVKPDDSLSPQIAGAARRFSRIAGIAVGIVSLTALYNVWLGVASFDNLWKLPYGWTVLVKTFLFILLLQLGAVNRYVNVPLLQHWAGIPPQQQGILDRIATKFFSSFLKDQMGYPVAVRFKKSVRIEACLMIVVLLCAALLRHEIPARHAFHLQHMGEHGTSPQHYGTDTPPTPHDHPSR